MVLFRKNDSRYGEKGISKNQEMNSEKKTVLDNISVASLDATHDILGNSLVY